MSDTEILDYLEDHYCTVNCEQIDDGAPSWEVTPGDSDLSFSGCADTLREAVRNTVEVNH